MKAIKSFIYLDEYKMYSISSQIFEGLTEHIVNYKVEEEKEMEKQKGEEGSGRILGDIIRKESGTHEKKFLHDYSYTLFEDKLIKDNKVLLIDHKNAYNHLDDIDAHSFIKVTGKAVFNDIIAITKTINGFKDFYKNFTYVQSFSSAAENVIENKNLPKTKSKNKQTEHLMIDGVEVDDKFLKSLAFLLDYGYKDQFQIQILLPLGEGEIIQSSRYSALLKRELLQENEDMLIKKFSRYSEKNFTIFGMVAQCKKKSVKPVLKDLPPNNMTEAIMNLLAGLSNMEDSFIAKSDNEVIIDPISVYREL